MDTKDLGLEGLNGYNKLTDDEKAEYAELLAAEFYGALTDDERVRFDELDERIGA